jgi:hypothetical protein
MTRREHEILLVLGATLIAVLLICIAVLTSIQRQTVYNDTVYRSHQQACTVLELSDSECQNRWEQQN